MLSLELIIHNDESALAHAFAECVAQRLRTTLRAHSRATLALSGGRSPVLFMQHLSRFDMDWHAVTVTLVDERWVPSTHVESNENLVRTHLLQNYAASATLVGLYAASDSAESGQATVEQRLQGLPSRLSVVVLGVGEDGHTASWFLHAPQYETCWTTEKRCLAVSPTTAAHERLTLSAHYVLQAEKIFIYAPGPRKMALLASVLQGGELSVTPIARLLEISHPRRQWWGSR